jgi:hypothetical protein
MSVVGAARGGSLGLEVVGSRVDLYEVALMAASVEILRGKVATNTHHITCTTHTSCANRYVGTVLIFNSDLTLGGIERTHSARSVEVDGKRALRGRTTVDIVDKALSTSRAHQ